MTWTRFIQRGIRWHTLSSVVMTFSQLIIMVAVARQLGPEAVGLLALALIWMRLTMPFIDLGFANSLIQKKELTRSATATLFWLQLTMAVVLFAVTWLVAAEMFGAFYREAELVQLIRLYGLTYLIAAPGLLFNAGLKKQLKFHQQAKIQIVAAVMELAVLLVLLFIYRTVWVVPLAYLARWLAMTIGSIALNAGYVKLSGSFAIKQNKSMIVFGLHDIGAQMVNQLTTQIDRFLIGKFLGTTALGFYVLAWDILIIPVARITGVFNQTIYPVFTKMQDFPKKLGETYMSTLKMIWLITLPLIFILGVYAEEIILLLFGSNWLDASPILTILCWAGVFKAISSTGYNVVLARGHAEVGLYWNLIWLTALSLAVTYVVVVLPSLASVAWSIVAATWLTGWVWHTMIHRVGGFPFLPLLRQLWRGLLYTLPLLICTYLLKLWLGPLELWLYLSLSIGLIGGLYFLTLYLFEKKFMRELKQLISF